MRDPKSQPKDVSEGDETSDAQGTSKEQGASNQLKEPNVQDTSVEKGAPNVQGTSVEKGAPNVQGTSVEKGVPNVQGMANGHGASNGVVQTQPTSQTFGNVDLENKPQHAVASDNDQTMDGVFDEAQAIRREINLICEDVNKLKEHNARMLNEVVETDRSALKKESNDIAGEIKSRAEGVLTRLQKMDAHSKELEAKHGVNAAVVRVARTQFMSLSNNFREVMFDYNETEMSYKESCKVRLQRQLEIVGREVTGEEIDQMIENGEWNVFNDNILTEGKTSRSALDQIESRHQELLDLESRIKTIHEIFLDVAMLVEEQGPMMNTIQGNIDNTDAALQEVIVKLERAKRYDKSNPCKKMFCGCFPCYH